MIFWALWGSPGSSFQRQWPQEKNAEWRSGQDGFRAGFELELSGPHLLLLLLLLRQPPTFHILSRTLESRFVHLLFTYGYTIWYLTWYPFHIIFFTYWVELACWSRLWASTQWSKRWMSTQLSNKNSPRRHARSAHSDKHYHRNCKGPRNSLRGKRGVR